MADGTSNGGERLDGWKAIADYLNRDVATVRRWEKTLGLPVRRVAGSGRSVFAVKTEIDAWLQPRPETVEELPPATAPVPARRRAWWTAGVVAIVAIASLLGWRGRVTIAAEDLLVEATSVGVVARDRQGAVRWRYDFPADYQVALSEVGRTVEVAGGADPAVYVATSQRIKRSNQDPLGGTLTDLDLRGRERRSFSFDDHVTIAGKAYGAPWPITTFAVDDSAGARRIAVAAHHWLWDPSVVTILDGRWQRRGTFVHAGWVEALEWMAPNRLLIGGFSGARNGGMVALLDPAAMDGQGPEPPGTTWHCESCGDARPLRMIVMPRSELNVATGSRFNRAVVERTGPGIVVRTIEMPPDNQGAVDVLYEFTPALDLVSATFSPRYWSVHAVLEAEGKLTHTREQCPDRDGPRQILVWEPASGWRTVRIR